MRLDRLQTREGTPLELDQALAVSTAALRVDEKWCSLSLFDLHLPLLDYVEDV